MTTGSRSVRTRSLFLLLLIVGFAGPAEAHAASSAAAGGAAGTRAVTGRMLASPRAEALVTRLPVRVVVRVPARTTRLRIRVGGRDVSGRFRGTRGMTRVADLTRADGLRFGRNHLFVLAERRGGRPVIQARTFVLGRRQPGLVRLGLQPGAVTSLSLRPATAPRLAAVHFRQRRKVERRLAAIRRERTVELWLNGRRITRVLDRSRPARWTASLSAGHGLRHGVNRLRILVAEPQNGRYELLRRRFVVPTDRHLASAGWDTSTRVGRRVRLDGRRSRIAGGGRTRFRWSIVAKPRGSHARLLRANAARPLLSPDRPGRYVVRLRVAGAATQATAAQATVPGEDAMTVVVAPQSPLVPFKGVTAGKNGIQVGDTFYPNPSPDGSAMQYLTLDRGTLTPTGTGNSWFDGSISGAHGVDTLAGTLAREGKKQLVIFSFPSSSSQPPVELAQNESFNNAMKVIGVGPIPAQVLQDQRKLAIMGVPYGGEGSGFYTHGGGDVDGMTGWLMHDATQLFRFQPERPAYDLTATVTPTSNSMTFRTQRVDRSLPAGATGGFQVAIVDPIDFVAVDNQIFATNGVADPTSALKAMKAYLDSNAGRRFHVAVQSVGRVAPPPLPADPYAEPVAYEAWLDVGQSLAAYGANPHTFVTADGAYAFLGGSWLERSEVVDSSTAVAIDPTTGEYESGTLRGRMSMRADGNLMPVSTDVSESFDFKLYDIVFSAPRPWPFTRAAGEPRWAEYDKALAYITKHLDRLDKYPDLRMAYGANLNITYAGSKTDLAAMAYPGDGYTCTDDPGRRKTDPGFTREQFCTLSAELQDEFDWLDATKDLFAGYQSAFGRSGTKSLVDLQTLGEKIRTDIGPDDADDIAWSSASFYGGLSSAFLVLAPQPEILVAWEAFMAAYEFARELVADLQGTPLGDEVTSKVSTLSSDIATRLITGASSLDRLREVIVSDFGRLKALGSVADGSDWKIDVSSTADALKTGANASFSSELMPVAYGVQWLSPTQFNNDPTTDNCFVENYGHTFRGTPATGQMAWRGAAMDDERLYAIAQRELSIRRYAYAPSSLTDAIFRSPAQGGYGVQLPRFIWEQYAHVDGVPDSPPTDIAYCH